jgi:hypothetical protein
MAGKWWVKYSGQKKRDYKKSKAPNACLVFGFWYNRAWKREVSDDLILKQKEGSLIQRKFNSNGGFNFN